MQAAELTLAAALRDRNTKRAEARVKAVQNLAPALLAEIDRPGPRWRAAHEHARGDEVLAALREAMADDDPGIRGLGAIGLGTLGEAEVLDRCGAWLEAGDASDDDVFVRQCAAIAIAMLGAAAPSGHEAHRRALALLRRAMRSSHDDVRFQAPIGLVDVGDADVERDLLAALKTEAHPDVRENLVAALSRLDPPPKATCRAMKELLAGEAGDDPIGFEAAMILASARDAGARARLMRGLHHRGERDRALEALAVLGPAPPDDLARVRELATSVWTPGVTRVRAAYAMSRMAPPGAADPGRPLLARLRFHPRAAVREAVRDAMTHLGAAESDG